MFTLSPLGALFSRLLALLAVAVSLGGCASSYATSPMAQPAASAAPKAGAELKVMTFNVRYGTANDGEDRWEKRRGLFMDVIRQNDPDVIGLQEALRFQIDEVRKEFPQYAEVGVGRDDGKTKGEYSAILYRASRLTLSLGDSGGTFWLSDTPEKVASKTWGNGITRICTWARLREADGRDFLVFNCHLDHQSEPSRRRSVELIASRMTQHKPAAPVILTGDFNCGEPSPAIQFLTGKAGSASGAAVPDWAGMTDTFRAVHPGETNVRTFHAFKGVSDTTGKDGPQDALTAKIDYIFVDRDHWQVLDAAIDRTSRDGRYPSDHFPVTARVRMK